MSTIFCSFYKYNAHEVEPVFVHFLQYDAHKLFLKDILVTVPSLHFHPTKKAGDISPPKNVFIILHILRSKTSH